MSSSYVPWSMRPSMKPRPVLLSALYSSSLQPITSLSCFVLLFPHIIRKRWSRCHNCQVGVELFMKHELLELIVPLSSNEQKCPKTLHILSFIELARCHISYLHRSVSLKNQVMVGGLISTNVIILTRVQICCPEAC